MTAMDASKWTKLNMWRLSSMEMCTRPGFRTIFTSSQLPPFISPPEIVAGFTAQNPFTGEFWHYILAADAIDFKNLTLFILDDNFQIFQQFAIKSDVIPGVVTFAVVQGYIVIASPDFPTVWGLIGSGVRYAEKVASDNPSTTAINVPRGICTAWCNRIVIANGNNIFVSDPIAATGGDARTFVAENQNQRPGVIYGIHEGAGGMLIALTSEGVYGLDSSAAAVQIVGSNGTDWRVLNHHRSTTYGSSAVIRGLCYALTQDGFILADQETGEEFILTDPILPRAFGPRISLQDYRTAIMLAWDWGPMVSAEAIDALFVSDLAHEVHSWWRGPPSPIGAAPGRLKVRGLLRDTDGNQMLLTDSAVIRVAGNFDGAFPLTAINATQPSGVLFAPLPSNPVQNMLVRHVAFCAEIGGFNSMSAAVRGKPYTTVPPVDIDGLTIGSDVWGTLAKRYTTTPLVDVRFDFGDKDSSATRDAGIEVSTKGCLNRVASIVDIGLSESATSRPTKTG